MYEATLKVSIHAPAKGATEQPPYQRQAACVSIHAPAKGATKSAAIIYDSVEFRSTPPRRGRH